MNLSEFVSDFLAILEKSVSDVCLASCGYRDRDVLQFLIFFLFSLGDFSLKMSNAETDPDVWGNNAVSALDFLKGKREEEELVNSLTAPLSDLPRVDCAFAYGSGVFPQPDKNHTSPTKEVRAFFFSSFLLRPSVLFFFSCFRNYSLPTLNPKPYLFIMRPKQNLICS